MEEGSLRVDANVSVRPLGASEFGTRCEVKNLNSLRSLERAIDYEVGAADRAARAPARRVAQETRHWDESDGTTHALRSKEEANDYRYFPEPDLVPLVPDAALLQAACRRRRPDARRARRRLFELVATGDGLATRKDGSDRPGRDRRRPRPRRARPRRGARRSRSAARPGPGRERGRGQPVRGEGPRPAAFAALLKMESSGQLSATQSKEVLAELMTSGDDPAQIAARLGYEQMDAAALEQMVDEVIAANPGEWERYREGDDKVAQFLLGQVMRSSKGRPTASSSRPPSPPGDRAETAALVPAAPV